MLDARKIAPRAFQPAQVDGCRHHTGTTREAVQDDAPGIDDHAVAMGLATVEVLTALVGSHHIAEVLDGTRAYQHFPVRPPGDGRECRRHHENLHARIELLPEQFGETQVVADLRADPPACP